MTRFTLRLPDDLHKWVTELARREHRTMHAQVLVILEQARADDQAREDAR